MPSRLNQYETAAEARRADGIRGVEMVAQAERIDLELWDGTRETPRWRLIFSAHESPNEVGAALEEIGAAMRRVRR